MLNLNELNELLVGSTFVSLLLVKGRSTQYVLTMEKDGFQHALMLEASSDGLEVAGMGDPKMAPPTESLG